VYAQSNPLVRTVEFCRRQPCHDKSGDMKITGVHFRRRIVNISGNARPRKSHGGKAVEASLRPSPHEKPKLVLVTGKYINFYFAPMFP